MALKQYTLIDDCLHELHNGHPIHGSFKRDHTHGVMLVGAEGLIIAATVPLIEGDINRIAALCNTLSNLGQKATASLGKGEMDEVTVHFREVDGDMISRKRVTLKSVSDHATLAIIETEADSMPNPWVNMVYRDNVERAIRYLTHVLDGNVELLPFRYDDRPKA